MSLMDDEILDLFFARSEKAIACLSEKYGRLCGNLAMNILGDSRDAEPYREIAKAAGMRESALRIRMLRVKKKLKAFLEERGVII